MSQPQNERLARWLNGLGAVLIVAGIIGVSLSVARSSRSASYGTAIWGGEGPSTRVAQAGGLYFVMTVTPGPYFLGELLQVDLSLANSSRTTYTLGGSSVAGPCGGAVYVNTSGGTGPHYTLPVSQDGYCPFLPTVFKPGQTLTLHQLLPLPSSGEVTLQSGADFFQSQVGPDGGQEMVPGHSPLDGYWPSLTISVAQVAPVDRRITLQHTGTTVQVSAPLAARTHLYDTYNLGCSNPLNDTQVGSGVFSMSGWGPLSHLLLEEPACGGGDSPTVRWSTVQWSYAVSAPGFSIAAGEQGYEG
jgi:hypothetical protein